VERERGALSLVRQPREEVEHFDLAGLYERMHGAMLRLAMTWVSKADAQDVVHDAVIKFMDQQARASRPIRAEDAGPRLLAMVIDVAKDRLRAKRRQADLLHKISGATAAMRRRSNTRRRAEDGEILAAIREALEHVAGSERGAWLLVKEQELTTREAAAALEVKQNTVQVALWKANKELCKHLKRLGITPETLRGREDR